MRGTINYDRYVWEAEAHANELLEMYPLDLRELLAPEFRRMWVSMLPVLLDPPKAAFVFLEDGPTARERRLAKLSNGEGHLLWAQARFLAIRSARGLRLAVHALPASGWGYRKAVRHAAEAVSQAQGLPSPEDVALLELPQ